jgi:stress response protein SCP2
MKITEILVEDGEFQRGRAFGKKLLSPSQWLSGGDVQSKSKSVSAVQTTSARAVKLTLNKVINGERLYRNDVIALKKIYADLQSNALTTAGDRKQTLAALKSAYNLQPVSTEQKAVLATFAKPL